ncbi:hypothetical protein SMACR_08227 [Sordaria macrospora]|uniref:WGS project CABT00000000 data, contig 2.43 n=2 Tax=Sordaria macrospora TaxID=5147 RepID=F7W878_SORMK|nr:uncharacterized protein SMAC_08227 [Sordaria macrospora k-hell]KAA8628344.1 hypothetical protein SMACR_08227 [Sordaria macrospora]KAH7632416.1 hypothetical protein B0T09DRAFT_394450 [Sordaria sp. MPI-SDFR-AT-0083]WPJ61085.1 hypothetical protein SMAC4_08227 [Sordaria macrospora]CCC13723.1 unnamed protein product [Sordaria macrospora k-hell]
MHRTSPTEVPSPEVFPGIRVSTANTDEAVLSALPQGAGDPGNVTNGMKYMVPRRRLSSNGGADVRGVIKYLPRKESIISELQTFDILDMPHDRFNHPVMILSKGWEEDTEVVRVCLVGRSRFSSD